MLTGNDAQEARAIAEARGIFKSRGLPTIGEVGDEAAYSFIVLICTGERDVRATVLSKAKEAARRGQLPSDAVRYCEARIRLDDAIVQARGRAPTRPQLRDEIQRLFAADPTQYANLYDRSQRDAGRVQLYGQNLECSPQSPTLHRGPIEDEANVNVRRATIGLVRLELYERVVIDTTSLTCGSAAPGK